MNPYGSLPGASGFAARIQQFSDQNDWKLAELDEKHATLVFNMPSERVQTLYIIRYEPTLEFSVPSAAAFDEDKVPDALSTLLLRRSASLKVGFWCIEKIKGKAVFSHMYNVNERLLDLDLFTEVVTALVRECDDFEAMLLKMMQSDDDNGIPPKPNNPSLNGHNRGLSPNELDPDGF